MDILQAIGDTSLVQLRKVVPPGCGKSWSSWSGRIHWQHEGSNGSRGHLPAEDDGRLKRGDTVVEYTGGSTGASLALVCAAKGYRIHIVSSDAFSPEKLDQWRPWAQR